jgi:hypothetical protein
LIFKLIEGGKNLEKKYIYRKHLREPLKFFLTIGGALTIIYAVGSVAMVSTFKAIDKIEGGLFLLGIGVGIAVFLSLEFALIYLIMYRRFKRIYVTLDSEGIIYNNANGEITIPYENIINLKFPSIKYTGGWLKIIHTHGNVRLTVVLENIGDMVKSLKNNLDERNMSDVYAEKKMYKFFKTAKYSDQSWERVYENVKYIIIFIVINLGVAAIFSGFITETPVKIIVLIGAILGSSIPFIISEIILGIKLAKGASKEEFSVPERDKSFEKRLYKWLFGIYTIVYFIVLAIIY